MDFSTGPWTWILPSLALTGMLLWFAVALVTRGLEFYRAELSAGPRFSWTPDWGRLPLQRRCLG